MNIFLYRIRAAHDQWRPLGEPVRPTLGSIPSISAHLTMLMLMLMLVQFSTFSQHTHEHNSIRLHHILLLYIFIHKSGLGQSRKANDGKRNFGHDELFDGGLFRILLKYRKSETT